MAFPTGDTTAADAAKLLVVRAKQLRTDAVAYIAQCDAGALKVHDVAASFMASELATVKAELTLLAAIPGVNDELARQHPDVFADATAAGSAVTAVLSAITTLISWLEQHLPVDASRTLLSLTVSNDGSGKLTQVTITAAGAIAAFRAQLVTFRDTFGSN
jgi:hypothetical protein